MSKEELLELSGEVIEKLPDEYRNLVKLYYYEDMNQKEIANIYNLTQMQVSRKMKKAFSLLYKMIADTAVEVQYERVRTILDMYCRFMSRQFF